MRKHLVFCIYTTVTFILISLSGFQKSIAQGVQSSWYNNPKKIVVAKEGETLTDLAHRLINQRIDSLGIELDDYRASYKSGPVWIMGIFGEPGQPISNVEQYCDSKGHIQIPIGVDFDGIGCDRDSFEKLKALRGSQPSKFKEYCRSAKDDPDQETIGYVNIKNHAFWKVYEGQIWVVGISSGKYYPLIDEGSMEACNLKVRADANRWFKHKALIENITGGCILDEKGPANFIETLDRSSQSYRVKDEVYIGEKVVQTTIKLNGQVDLMYFRGRARCEAYINSVRSQKDAERKKNRAKYE